MTDKTLQYRVDEALRSVQPDFCLRTRSGLLIDLRYGCTEVPPISDIALGLSRQARFCGQLERFYTVAEHSVYVSQLCGVIAKEACASTFEEAIEAEKCGLFHDAAEAFIADVPLPVKQLMRASDDLEYREIEHRILRPILAAYACVDHDKYKDIVKLADRIAFLQEHRDFRGGNDYPFLAKTPLVAYGSSAYAKDDFMNACVDLGVC